MLYCSSAFFADSMFKPLFRFVNFFPQYFCLDTLKKVPRQKNSLGYLLRLFLFSFRNFEKNNNSLKASALTFLSALSFVPIIGVLFGISHGFGLDIKGQVLNFLQGQEMIMEKAFEYAENLLGRTRSDLITGTGILVLFFTVMRLLHNIEDIFNGIWNIKNHRSLQRKFSDYTAIVLTSPLLIFFSSSLTVFVATEVVALTHHLHLGYFSHVINFLLKLLPYTLIWMLLTLFYAIMPNTKVKVHSAVIAGVLAGTIFQVLQWGYIHFQVGVSQYNAVYGSLAALPLFLIWMQISWMIILFGAEFSFSLQYLPGHTHVTRSSTLSFREKKVVSLWVLSCLIRAFREGEKPVLFGELVREVSISKEAMDSLIDDLKEMGLVAEVVLPDRYNEKGYQPGMDIQSITPYLLFKKLEETSGAGLFNDESGPWVKEFANLSSLTTKDQSLLKKPLTEVIKHMKHL